MHNKILAGFTCVNEVQVIMPTEVEIIFIRHAVAAGDQGALICIPENSSSQMDNEEPDWQGGDNK